MLRYFGSTYRRVCPARVGCIGRDNLNYIQDAKGFNGEASQKEQTMTARSRLEFRRKRNLSEHYTNSR